MGEVICLEITRSKGGCESLTGFYFELAGEIKLVKLKRGISA